MALNSNLQVYINFMGYGNPDSDVWFVGREEGSVWAVNPEEVNDLRGNSFNPVFSFGNPQGGRTYSGYKVLLESLYPDELESTNFFVSNVFPFGLDNGANYSISQKQFLGLNENDDINKNEETFQARCAAANLFYAQHKSKNRKLFICYGYDDLYYLDKFLIAIGYDAKQFRNIDNGGYVRLSADSKVLLLPHASHSNFQKFKVLETLKSVL